MDPNLKKYKGSKQLLIILTIITLIQSVAIICQAIFLAKAIVQMYNGMDTMSVLPSLAFFLLSFLVKNLMQWAKSRLAYRFADDTANYYQKLLVNKLFELGPRAVGKHGSGNLVTLSLEGIPSFRTYLELFPPRLVSMMIIPVVLLLYVFATDLTSGIVLMVVLPILIAFLILLGVVAKKQKDAKWATYQLLSRHFVDSLRGLVTLKYIGRSKEHREAIWTVSNKYRIATNRTLRVAFLSTFSLDFFSSLSVAVVAVELGLRLINGHIGFEAALAILILAPEYFMPVRELGNDYHATMDGKEAGKKIHALLDEKVVKTSETPQLESWTKDSKLAIRNLVKTSEQENRDLLKDLSFYVQGHQKIGIIGLSGAGKSTLIDILAGFTEKSAGNIVMNGKLVDSFSSWQHLVTYIPQHPYIFSGSILENITLYTNDVTDDEIWQAVEVAGLTELVQKMPNGLQEKIGQGGRVLSGGEEQRIALARAFLGKKPIMMFDEPIAHLDIETEHEMKQLILPMLENKLVFFATHRLHWMKNMDFILVLENGEIVESGTEEDLLAEKGAYYRLWKGGQSHEAV